MSTIGQLLDQIRAVDAALADRVVEILDGFTTRMTVLAAGPWAPDPAFVVGAPVTIKPISTAGRVEALLYSAAGWEYRVAYWFNGERRAEWMPAAEIEGAGGARVA